jgi:hypothetical protein
MTIARRKLKINSRERESSFIEMDGWIILYRWTRRSSRRVTERALGASDEKENNRRVTEGEVRKKLKSSFDDLIGESILDKILS